jgi:hypothetical protein
MYFYFNFYFFRGTYCKKIALFFVNRATLLQISLEVIQYPLSTALEDKPSSKGFRGYWQPSYKDVLFAKVVNTL